MSKKQKPKTISWDAFQTMGNPDNVNPENNEEEVDESSAEERSKDIVRVYLERKNRGGKTATIVKGIMDSENDLLVLTKEMKSALGVGGTMKNGDRIKFVILPMLF